MTKRKDFIKIRAGLNKGLHPMYITSTGIKFNDKFLERLYEVEEEFRSKLILPINDVIGSHNWAIHFIEHPTDNPTYFADIYADNAEDCNKIIGIIKNTIDDIQFSYYYKGNIDNYLKE